MDEDYPARIAGPALACTLASMLMFVSLAAPPAPPAGAPPPSAPAKTPWTLVGWNNLGMHCMDSDYSVFSILPPYNTIHAQLIDPSGTLVTDPSALGISVTYESAPDPAGSINTTSAGKTNFWTYVLGLFGATPPVDTGLTGIMMPGGANTPQPMGFDPAARWFIGEGIPITPYDDAGSKNPYPLMRLVARDSSSTILATTDIVLPVSDEMDCSACHSSGSDPVARPARGWSWDTNPERDYRLNILLLHDEKQAANPLYPTVLAASGYSSAGLYTTVTSNGRSILCATCHLSEALPGTGQAGVPPLTTSVHFQHAPVLDPTNGMTLDSSNNRSACYRCHPGSTTRCLRGVMGNSVATDGSMEMQCQGCHGNMTTVGDAARTGWLEEPTCQNCHTGVATQNNGQIRYTSAFDSPGHLRIAVNQTFATDPDTPAPGFSLYRFSNGHGNLLCESCHGSTHAEYPSSHLNDNLQNQNLQGHSGMLVECAACHNASPQTVTLGPHGMHQIGQQWVNDHPDLTGNPAACRDCHGTNFRGTVLSLAKGTRTISTPWGPKNLYKGYQVGCYNCHLGPNSSNGNPNRAPVAQNSTLNATAGVPAVLTLNATDADGNPLTLSLIDQPAHGTAGLAGTSVTYFPYADYTGPDQFTFAAWDGSTQSNLANVSVTVGPSPCTVVCSANVPASAPAGSAVFFQSLANVNGCAGTVVYDWNFGDGSPHATTPDATSSYTQTDSFRWTLNVTAGTVATGMSTCSDSGVIRTLSTPSLVPALLQPLRVATANQGEDLSLTFDASNCPSAGYHLLYGYGSGIAGWVVSGGVCDLGVTGSASWDTTPDPSPDPTHLLWFLVAGDDMSSTEGSWGLTSSGAERGGSGTGGVCGMTDKSLVAVCAAP